MRSRPQVSATEDGNIIKDSNVVLEIPAPTTIAYGVIELYVRADGQFGECASAQSSLEAVEPLRRDTPSSPETHTCRGSPAALGIEKKEISEEFGDVSRQVRRRAAVGGCW